MIQIANFQPYKSETIYSIVSRYHALSGALDYFDTLKEIFGNHKKRLHPYLPSQINNVGRFFHLESEELLVENTLFPLFELFNKNAALQLKQSMLTGLGSPIIHAHLPQYKLPLFTGHKYCPVCAQLDVNDKGCSFWHIEHQIPGITACRKHGVELRGLINADGHLDRQLTLPPTDKSWKNANTTDVLLAKYSSKVFSFARRCINDEGVKNIYRTNLEAKRLIVGKGTIKFEIVQTNLIEFWRELTFGHELGVPKKVSNFDFIGPLLRLKTGTHAHPLKHLLFSCWLFNGKPNFLLKTDIQLKNELPDVIIPNRELLVLHLLKSGTSMNQIEEKTGNSRCYIRRIAELNNIPHASNANSYQKSKRHLVIIQAQLGRHRKYIARALKVGVGYVEQIISNTPGLVSWRKKLWKQKKLNKALKELDDSRKQHKKWLRKDFKAVHNQAFFYLYHHAAYSHASRSPNTI